MADTLVSIDESASSLNIRYVSAFQMIHDKFVFRYVCAALNIKNAYSGTQKQKFGNHKTLHYTSISLERSITLPSLWNALESNERSSMCNKYAFIQKYKCSDICKCSIRLPSLSNVLASIERPSICNKYTFVYRSTNDRTSENAPLDFHLFGTL